MAKKEENFYVGIEESVDIRRTLLEVSKVMVGALKKYEELRPLNEKKKTEMERFKTLVREISSDVLKLKENLPQFKLSELPKKKHLLSKPAAKPWPGKKVTKIKLEAKKLSPQTAKLERELNEIEEKLKQLQ
jgi:chromosome segregation ATPase